MRDFNGRIGGHTVVDLRGKLPRAKGWEIGRRAATSSITWHWNGPSVAPHRQQDGGLLTQLVIDTRFQMKAGWGGTKNGADGLQYHFVVDSEGVVYQTRDMDAMLWHCGHAEGNGQGLAIHFPRGKRVDGVHEGLTLPQWNSARALTDALCTAYGLGRSRVLGHLEWKHMTECPGRTIMGQLEGYRGGRVAQPAPTEVPGLAVYELRATATVLVRQGPGRSFPVAGRLKPGTRIWVDVVKTGEAVDGNTDWVHMARVPNEQADLGFISGTIAQKVA